MAAGRKGLRVASAEPPESQPDGRTRSPQAAAGFGEQDADFGERDNGDSTSRRSYPADFGEQANISKTNNLSNSLLTKVRSDRSPSLCQRSKYGRCA
jgi:hypothetical protein